MQNTALLKTSRWNISGSSCLLLTVHRPSCVSCKESSHRFQIQMAHKNMTILHLISAFVNNTIPKIRFETHVLPSLNSYAFMCLTREQWRMRKLRRKWANRKWIPRPCRPSPRERIWIRPLFPFSCRACRFSPRKGVYKNADTPANTTLSEKCYWSNGK